MCADMGVSRYRLVEYRIFGPVLEGECPGPWTLTESDQDGSTFRMGEWEAICPPLTISEGWAECRICGYGYRVATEVDGVVVYRRNIKACAADRA